MKTILILLAAALSAGTVAASDGAVQQTYVYHGALLTASGSVPTERTQKLTFALYAQAEGGTALWEETQEITLDATGTFVAELGCTSSDSAEALTAQLDDATVLTYYLDIRAGDAPALTPRQRLFQTPTVLHAEVGNGSFRDFTVTGDAEVDGALWANTITVEELQLNEENHGLVAVEETATIHTAMEVAAELKLAGQAAVPKIRAKRVEGHLIKGMIVPWFVPEGSSTAIPEGWALCDGTNGTPDLRGRYIRGAGDTTPLGETYDGYRLQVENLPAHTHSGTYRTKEETRNVILSGNNEDGTQWSSGSSSVTLYTEENETEHLPLFSEPPFQEMRFIMYTGEISSDANGN